MKVDPIIREVRTARRGVERDAAMAGTTLGAYLRERQKEYEGRLVRRAPQQIQKSKTA